MKSAWGVEVEDWYAISRGIMKQTGEKNYVETV